LVKYPEGRQQSAVILLLWRAQEQAGGHAQKAIEYVAEVLGMPRIRVLEVATFTMFNLSWSGSTTQPAARRPACCVVPRSSKLLPAPNRRSAIYVTSTAISRG
jgi:NADH-quinone oxidoreductase subunit E